MHSTNRKHLDSTRVGLVKDDTNSEFTVAFFLSNRLDQIVQKVFFDELWKSRNIDIKTKYFMSDNNAEYYNV